MLKRSLMMLSVLGMLAPAFAAYPQNGAPTAPQTGAPTMGYPQNGMPPGQPPASGPNKILWYTNYNQAVLEAKQKNKPIILFFTGSDWCGWCKKMVNEVFSSPDFAKEVGGAFVFVEVDFPMNKQLSQQQQQQNNLLKQKYAVTGYPTIIILDANENFLAETGYRPGGGKAYADYLKQYLS